MLNKVRICKCLLLSLKHDGQKQKLFASNIIGCIKKAKNANESSQKHYKGKKEGSRLRQETSADLNM